MTLTHICSNQSTSSLTNVDEDSIQPNAVDLRLDRVWEMSGQFEISEQHKKHRYKLEIMPDHDGNYVLKPGTYEVTFAHSVAVGLDEAGWVITRSTLNRNGLFLTSGLYDSGYGIDGNGSMAACLHVEGGVAKIAKGTRIGQYVNFKAQSLKAYDGDYGKAGGIDSYLRQ